MGMSVKYARETIYTKFEVSIAFCLDLMGLSGTDRWTALLHNMLPPQRKGHIVTSDFTIYTANTCEFLIFGN